MKVNNVINFTWLIKFNSKSFTTTPQLFNIKHISVTLQQAHIHIITYSSDSPSSQFTKFIKNAHNHEAHSKQDTFININICYVPRHDSICMWYQVVVKVVTSRYNRIIIVIIWIQSILVVFVGYKYPSRLHWI